MLSPRENIPIWSSGTVRFFNCGATVSWATWSVVWPRAVGAPNNRVNTAMAILLLPNEKIILSGIKALIPHKITHAAAHTTYSFQFANILLCCVVPNFFALIRSEERRVGKECNSWGSLFQCR